MPDDHRELPVRVPQSPVSDAAEQELDSVSLSELGCIRHNRDDTAEQNPSSSGVALYHPVGQSRWLIPVTYDWPLSSGCAHFNAPTTSRTSLHSASAVITVTRTFDIQDSKLPYRDLPFRYFVDVCFTDYLLMGLMIPVMILRIILATLFFVMCWLMAHISLIGIDKDDLKTNPMKGWRQHCQRILRASARCMFFFCGLHWVKIKGCDLSQKTTNPAPCIVLVAPHISYMDSFLCTFLNCGVMARAELRKAPFFGVIVKSMQPLLVDREDSQRYQVLSLTKHEYSTTKRKIYYVQK